MIRARGLVAEPGYCLGPLDGWEAASALQSVTDVVLTAASESGIEPLLVRSRRPGMVAVIGCSGPVKAKETPMRVRAVLGVIAAAISMLVAASPALADNNHSRGVAFFHSPGAEARWAHFVPPPPGDRDTWSIKLRLPAGDPTAYAGAELRGVAGPPPATPPAFDYYSTVAGPSGGSPRLHINFSDGGSADLRPLILLAGVWAREDGATLDWDNNGGPCGFKYEVSYQVILACHAGATVTSVYVVTDSAWLYATGYTHWIDNIRHDGKFVTRPGGDGEGDQDNQDDGSGGDNNGQQ